MREQTPQEKEYNRMAMAKVRSDVRAFVEAGQTNGMAHLGEYPKTMEDAVRTIIALQDLLNHSMNKHQLATDKVLEQKRQIEGVINFSNYALNDATNSLLQHSGDVAIMQKTIGALEDECQRLSSGWNETIRENQKMQHELLAQRDLTKAHKMVLKDSL